MSAWVLSSTNVLGLNHTEKRVPRNVREQKPFLVDLSSIGTAIELLQPSSY